LFFYFPSLLLAKYSIRSRHGKLASLNIKSENGFLNPVLFKWELGHMTSVNAVTQASAKLI